MFRRLALHKFKPRTAATATATATATANARFATLIVAGMRASAAGLLIERQADYAINPGREHFAADHCRRLAVASEGGSALVSAVAIRPFRPLSGTAAARRYRHGRFAPRKDASFFGELTRVLTGHIRIRSAGKDTIRSRGSGAMLESQRS